VEAIDTNDGLFKIESTNILIRLIHINADVFDIVQFILRELLKMAKQVVFVSRGSNINDRMIIEIIEDAGILGIKIRILGIDFIDTDRLRERDVANVAIFIKNSDYGWFRKSSEFSGQLKSYRRITEKIHDFQNHLIRSRRTFWSKDSVVTERMVAIQA